MLHTAAVPFNGTEGAGVDAIEDLLEFGLTASFETLPEPVIERTRLAILDTLAAMA
jgi:hypothetical protein